MNSYKSNIKIDKVNNINHMIKYKDTKFEKLFLENKNLIPDFNHSTLSFNIYNTKSSFVNALRRCILDELLVKSLYFDIPDITSNDYFILNDLIQKRVKLISTSQSINSDVKFSLSVHNNSTEIIPIKTSSIINSNDKDNKIYFNQNIKLCDLKPNKVINIKNIHIKSDYGLNDNIYSIGKASYEVINIDMDKIHSMSTDATDFIFYTYSNGNIHPVNILLNTIETLQKRLDNINNLISNYDNELINDELIINKTDYLTEYFIKNEYHTLGNLIVDYMFDLDTSTKLLNYNNDHPSKNEITIKTDSSDADKLILNAIINIKIDLDNLYKLISSQKL